MRVEELLIRQKDNKKIAVIHGQRQISYRSLFEQVSNVAAKISDDSSMNVVLLASNSIEYIIGYFAILVTCRVVIPVNHDIKEDELTNILTYSDADLLITTDDKLEFCMNALREKNLNVSVLVIEKNGNKDKSVSCEKRRDENKIDVAIMLQTSGTSSNPKRVMLTHNNLLSNINSNIENLQLTDKDVFLVNIPLCFGYCNTAIFLTSFFLGATLVIADTIFTGRTFLANVEKNKVTVFTCVPSLLYILGNTVTDVPYDIKSLRYICFGGAKTDCALLEKLITKYPSVGFVQTYGQTEASPRVTSLLPQDSLRKIGSVGKPIPNVKVCVVDENDKVVEAGVDGEIIVSGPNVMKGYYKREDITRNTIRNQWLHTGDIGHFDEDGYLYIIGRIKNIIISNGINIYPEEIEEILMQYPGIKAVRVYGKKDDLYGEKVEAEVVTEIEHEQDEIISWCKTKLSLYKVPRHIKFVDAIERTYNGKIKRFSEGGLL